MTRKPAPMEASTAAPAMSTATMLCAHRSSHHHRHQRNCKQLPHEVNVRPTTPKSFVSPTTIAA
jgi:hypothetical protein